ncbi:MAG: leucine--tRNA ligase [Gemmatimonadota bacterium]|nr:leucine--tRNA ligase [Gemmatimonadota bacterium]MDE2871036.1 leucine--tRNA ligase [Gemmatimonadota bacterium]
MSTRSDRTYDPAAIEREWQATWDREGTNSFTLDELRTARRPFYNLMMFPYPSAEGLHVGNIYAFTGADVHGRFQRMRGHDVFEPIGFDAFGIHSENFALKAGVHPMDLIPGNVANFTRQLRRMGGMFDWDHTVDTTAPDYYRWTQWLFLQFFKHGLAEQKEAPVNWCPSDMTVLANEQVVVGACERCGTPVEQRFIRQWFLRITEYAGRLLDNLSAIDWSDTTRKAQRAWIRRSRGAEILFPVMEEADKEADGGNPAAIPVFTTRPDTIFGATYMVLAPEHPLVDAVTSDTARDEVDAYRARTRAMDLVARQKIEKHKTGVFTGGYCINPATRRPIPVWIADYVLMGYGTGAIMAVPGHDERDFDFANAYGLPIVRVVADEGEDAGTPLAIAYEYPQGTLVNSGRYDGLSPEEAHHAIVDHLGAEGLAESQVTYRLHDWCISRQRYWGPPIPIIHCEDCGPVAVPDEDLPVVLPRVEDFRPDESGVSPLARVRDWYEVPCPSCGRDATRETDVSDTFLDSAWYFLRYPCTDFDDRPFDAEITRRWLPVDTYIGGNEHAVLHLLYARFVAMALHDMGRVDFEEPFTQFRAHGLIIRGGAKMSKSKGNVIIPDPIIERYGADTFRLYLMFLGPFMAGGDYQDKGIAGPHGFLHRLWESVVPRNGELADGPPDPELETQLHRTIQRVTDQVAALRYNTAIAAMMEYLNAVRAGGRTPVRAEVEPLVRLVAPFAPHIAEELWRRLGNRGSIFDGANWPEFDAAKAAERQVRVAVQVNGKVRGTVSAPKGADREAVVAAARAEPNVARHLAGMAVRKVIHVPDRLLNFVVAREVVRTK